MPTSGTHITVLQRLALDKTLQGLLGDPTKVRDDSPEGLKCRYANLGAVGPDIFYAMADYGSDLQDLEDFLVKVGGTFECITELMGAVTNTIDNIVSTATLGVSNSITQTSQLISAIISNEFIALMLDVGFNFWPVFEAARQRDKPREGWYWADYLHYIHTGLFTKTLLNNALASKNQYLIAYAYGYVTHYVTDVVGHPYVNQVVQAPWRLYWQRHHLVENFIDAYVWDRWHSPQIGNPSDPEPPLDKVTPQPNSIGTGAPYSYARLNDHINVGKISLGDPVDAIVQQIAGEIAAGLFSIGIAVNLNPATPTEADFAAWTRLMADTIRDVYANDRHPMNLAPGRADGLPTAEDIGAAYGTFRLVLKVATEDKITEPKMPNIVADISAIVQQLEDQINAALASVPPFPAGSFSGGVSLSNICQALMDTCVWITDVLIAVTTVVADFVAAVATLAVTIAADALKYALYLLNKALYTAYKTLRFALVQAAYATPYTEDLVVAINSSFNTQELWRSTGNPSAPLYPSEERDEQRHWYGNHYHPFVPPRSATAKVEQPSVPVAAPYAPGVGGLTLPDDFIDRKLGNSDMFVISPTGGPAPLVVNSNPGTFDSASRDYGGALEICRNFFIRISSLDKLPDYNLDGDRGYGWPTWDVSPAPTPAVEPPADPFAPNPNAPDPLNPTNPSNATGEAVVNAVLVDS
jgi:hypothetical protein